MHVSYSMASRSSHTVLICDNRNDYKDDPNVIFKKQCLRDLCFSQTHNNRVFFEVHKNGNKANISSIGFNM